MFGVRTCLLVALIVTTTSVTSAEDYILPTGVTVLTEEEFLNQIIGSTLIGGKERWLAYFLPLSGDQKKGGLGEEMRCSAPLAGTGRLTGL